MIFGGSWIIVEIGEETKTFVELPQEAYGERPELDPFEDDEPVIALCDLENPEYCESCQ